MSVRTENLEEPAFGETTLADINLAGRLEQLQREVVRSRELVAELRRQIGVKDADIRQLRSEFDAVARLRRGIQSPAWVRLNQSLSWIARRAAAW